MTTQRASARINIKALIILVVVIGALGVGAFGFHHVRKRMQAQDAQTAGMTAFENAEWEDASTQLRRYLKQYPDDQEILDKFVEASLNVRPPQDKYIGEALSGLRRIVRTRPDDRDVVYKLTELYVRTRTYEEAIYFGERGIEAHPGDAEIAHQLAKAYYGVRRLDEAEDLLVRLVNELDPSHIESYLLLVAAITEKSDANVAAAAPWLDLCVDNNPNAPKAYLLRATFKASGYQGRKEADLDGARADLEAAQSLATENPLVKMALAEQWMRLGEADLVADQLAALEQVDPELLYDENTDPAWFTYRLLVNLAELSRLRADTKEMVAVADRGLAELGEDQRSTFLKTAVELYIAADEYEQAEKNLLEYQSYAESSARLKSELGDEVAYLGAQLATVQDRPFDAINLLEDVTARNPRNPAPALLLARAYSDSGQPRQAVRTLRQASTNVPGHLMTITRLARESLRVGQWEDALRYAESCEQMTDGRLDCILMRMEAAARVAEGTIKQDAVLARINGELDQLREAFPEAYLIPLLQSMIATGQDRPDDAVALLQTAASLPDAGDDVITRLARLLTQQNRRDEAIETCRNYVTDHPEATVIWLTIADLQQSAGDVGGARNTLNEAAGNITTPNAKRDIDLALARWELIAGERDKGIAMMKEVAANNKNDALVRSALLEMPEIMEDRALANEYVTQMKAVEGDNGLRWRLHQSRLWMTGDDLIAKKEEIEKLLNFCIDADANWVRPAMLLGRVHEVSQDWPKAEAVYRATLTANPRAAQAADRLLALLRMQARDTEAESVLANLPANTPGLGKHRVDLAVKRGDFVTAINILNAMVERDARDTRSRLLLARLLYREQRNAERALELLREVEQADPTNPEIIAVRAFIMSTEGENQDALALLNEKVEQRKDYESYFIRGEFHAARGNDDAAEMDFRALTQFDDRAADGWERLGRFFQRRNRTEEAIDAWRTSINLDADRLSAKRSLAGALLSSGDDAMVKEGRNMLADAEEQYPDDPDLLLMSARVLISDGNPDDRPTAESKLQNVIEADPKAITAYLLLVQLALQDEQLDEATNHVTRGLSANPNHPDLLLARANVEVANNNMAAARRFAESVISVDPKRRPAHVMLFEIALADGRQDEAVTIAGDALEQLGDDVYFVVRRAELMAAAGQLESAIADLSAFVDRLEGADTVEPLLALSEMHCRQGNVTAFDSALSQANTAGANETQQFVRRFRCLGAIRGEFDTLPDMLLERKARDPEDFVTLMFGASILAGSQDPAHQVVAQNVIGYVAEKQPDNVEARMTLAQIAYQDGDMDHAISFYEQAHAVSPDDTRVLNDLAWVLAETGRDVERALELATRAVELAPNDPHVHDTRGYVLSALGKFSEAAVELNSAAELADNAPRTKAGAYLKLAKAYLELGSKVAARSALQQAKAIDDRLSVLNEAKRSEMQQLLDRVE